MEQEISGVLEAWGSLFIKVVSQHCYHFLSCGVSNTHNPWKPADSEIALFPVFVITGSNFHGLAGHLPATAIQHVCDKGGITTQTVGNADWHTRRAGAALPISALLPGPRSKDHRDRGVPWDRAAWRPGRRKQQEDKQQQKCLKSCSIYMNSIFPVLKCTPASLKIFWDYICPKSKGLLKLNHVIFVMHSLEFSFD